MASQTQIKLEFLESLEEETYHHLPDPSYLTGFLRRYAIFLGLDADSVVKAFQEQMSKPLMARFEPIAERDCLCSGSEEMEAAPPVGCSRHFGRGRLFPDCPFHLPSNGEPIGSAPGVRRGRREKLFARRGDRNPQFCPGGGAVRRAPF